MPQILTYANYFTCVVPSIAIFLCKCCLLLLCSRNSQSFPEHGNLNFISTIQLIQCCSVTASCLTLCKPTNCIPGFPVLHHLPEIAQTHVGKEMSLLFNTLPRLVMAFLPRSKHLLLSRLQSPSTVIWEQHYALSLLELLAFKKIQTE